MPVEYSCSALLREAWRISTSCKVRSLSSRWTSESRRIVRDILRCWGGVAPGVENGVIVYMIAGVYPLFMSSGLNAGRSCAGLSGAVSRIVTMRRQLENIRV